MRNKLIALMMIASQFALWGCYFEGPEYTDELDLVYTNHDSKFDFAGKGTYSLPDKIVKITGDPLAPPEYINDIPYGKAILDQIELNMNNLGWTKVDVNAVPPPDLQLLPAAWTTTTIVYGGYYGGYYCWYYPYYCGGGWYYPYYPVSSYSSGTLLMTLVNPNVEVADGSKQVTWTGALNGLLGSTDIGRIKKGIDQAFTQSPYLKTN
ncbi:MAG: DUF4136 domain-containing protein [Cyclobacteriaceae bacterium]|nr:DUF4136 domain-containing protein [Cyclobacteriaceae bacterium]